MRIIRALVVCIIIILAAAGLSSCRRVVRSPKDELTMYSWRSEFDNGNVIELSFDGDDACFSAHNNSFDMDIGGYCTLEDERFIIYDDETRMSFEFAYILHGDSVELSYDSGSVTLGKIAGSTSEEQTLSDDNGS